MTVVFIGEKMEAAGPFKILVVIYQKIQYNFPEACTLAGRWICQIYK